GTSGRGAPRPDAFSVMAAGWPILANPPNRPLAKSTMARFDLWGAARIGSRSDRTRPASGHWRGREVVMAHSFRRFTTLVAAGLIVVLAFGAGLSSAAPAAKKLTREQVATKLLNLQHGRFFSPNARMALQRIKQGTTQQAAAADRDASPGRAKQASGGLAAAPVSGLANVRVNDPAADNHQPDQTTQSET